MAVDKVSIMKGDYYMVETDSKVEQESETIPGEKICACGKVVTEVFQNDMCRECLTQRFKELVQLINSVRK